MGPSVVILDISDVSKPKLVGQLNYSPPFKGGLTSGHDVLKIPGKPLLFVHSEGSGGDTHDHGADLHAARSISPR